MITLAIWWSCYAWSPSHVYYRGIAKTEFEAIKKAVAACKAAGYLDCRITDCIEHKDVR